MNSSRKTEKADEANKTITELRKVKKDAIKNLNYEYAKSVEEQIKQIHIDLEESIEKETKEEFLGKMEELIENSTRILKSIEIEYQNKERSVRTRMNDLFETMKQEHYSILINFEKLYAEAKLNESNWVPPEYTNILELSRKTAAVGQFDEAIALRKQAEDYLRVSCEARFAKVDEEFEEKKETMFKKQQEDIESLVKKLKEELENLEIRKELEINDQHSIRSTKVISLLQIYNTKTKNTGSKVYEAMAIEMLNKYGYEEPTGIKKIAPVKKELRLSQSSIK